MCWALGRTRVEAHWRRFGAACKLFLSPTPRVRSFVCARMPCQRAGLLEPSCQRERLVRASRWLSKARSYSLTWLREFGRSSNQLHVAQACVPEWADIEGVGLTSAPRTPLVQRRLCEPRATPPIRRRRKCRLEGGIGDGPPRKRPRWVDALLDLDAEVLHRDDAINVQHTYILFERLATLLQGLHSTRAARRSDEFLTGHQWHVAQAMDQEPSVLGAEC